MHSLRNTFFPTSMLHPKAPPRAVHSVEVGGAARHVLHVTEYGAADGLPLVYLHGGPGGGTPPDLPRLFDPSTFRLVAFDQRGCGGSRCADRLRANTTADILSDIEAVRAALGIDRWAVMGSSYGSLLAALYAARHAASVRWVVLHGVFLGSTDEVRWLYEPGGASRFYPHQWKQFADAAPPLELDGASPPTSTAVAPQGGSSPGAPAGSQPHEVAAGTPSDRPLPGMPRLLAMYHRALTAPKVPRAHPLASADSVPHAALSAAASLTRCDGQSALTGPEPEPGTES